jgi:hypothetical protein
MGIPREEVKVIIIILSQKNKPEGIPVIPRDPGDVIIRQDLWLYLIPILT